MNKGGITANDGKEQIMAMITGASVSNVDVATQVKISGNVNIEGLLRNTPNVIPWVQYFSDIAPNAMQIRNLQVH